MLGRIEDVGSEHGLKGAQAFGRWFAGMFFDKPHDFPSRTAAAIGRSICFFKQATARKWIPLHSEYKVHTNTTRPHLCRFFYDEINRFWQAFANKANRTKISLRLCVKSSGQTQEIVRVLRQRQCAAIFRHRITDVMRAVPHSKSNGCAGLPFGRGVAVHDGLLGRRDATDAEHDADRHQYGTFGGQA